MPILDQERLLKHLGTLVFGELTGKFLPRKERPGKGLIALPEGSTITQRDKAMLNYSNDFTLYAPPGYMIVQRGALPDGRAYEFLQLELKALDPLDLGHLVREAPWPLNHPILSGYQLKLLAYENGEDFVSMNRKDIARFQPWRVGVSMNPAKDIPTGAALTEGANIRVRYLGHGIPIEDRLYTQPQTSAPSRRDAPASGL